MINFTINGQPVTAAKGETILQAARKAGFYIPTMCYLEKTTPCASCRLCVVETDKTEGFILSCQTPPTEGLAVTIDSEALQSERTNIMRLYDVNHPLECGVCDKSGACDLQNKTLEFGVDRQHFSAKEQHRKIEHWGLINYDPSLCILCEKCVHVCNEIIGDDAITLQFGGYKSSVIPKNSETLDCTFCGECIAVCPVGALVSSDFQYTANAWELTQIPATCVHCSAGCSLTYEVRHTSNSIGAKPKIYRVTNDFEHTTLCGAGRFGFDFGIDAAKEEAELARAADSINEYKAIRFSSMITNEEALILQKLKETLGLKLYNEEARAYRRFMDAYGSISGKKSYGGSAEAVAASDGIIVFGGRVSTDNPALRYSITTAARHNGAKVVYMHPLEDALLQNVVTQYVKYEVGTEEGVAAMLARTVLKEADISEETRRYFDDLDEGYLCAESNVGSEEFERIAKTFGRTKRKTLVIGSDLLNHRRSENIARLCAMIETYTEFSVVVAAPSVNTVGVSLICDLDVDRGAPAVGYNATGVYTMGSLANVQLPLPALNSQEGTFVSMNNQVLPTNVAVPFSGYTLNDVAAKLGVSTAYTIDYTVLLPKACGFEEREFDDLGNFFGPLGEDKRGYILENVDVEALGELEEVDDLPEFNGTVVYRCNPVNQFNAYTAQSRQLEKDTALRGSAQFAAAAKIANGDKIRIEFGSGSEERVFVLDGSLKGTVALVPSYDGAYGPANDNYRFEKVKISRVGSEG